MKLFPKKLRGTDPDRGYLQMRGTTLDYGYQKHGAFALVFSFLEFWLVLALTNLSDVLAALIAAALMYAYGWVTELTHHFKKHRVYDPWDAHIMLPFALIGAFFAVLLRAIFYHTVI